MRFLLFILVANVIFSSTIPQYQISSVQDGVVTFSNQAVIDVHFQDVILLKGWNSGDMVEVVSINIPTFGLLRAKIVGGQITVDPIFALRNLTRNSEQVAVWLQQAPVVPSPVTYTVTAMDLLNQIITLDDSTTWIYGTEDGIKIGTWEIGDVIMIGENGPTLFPAIYDSVLFNASRQSIIKTIQQ